MSKFDSMGSGRTQQWEIAVPDAYEKVLQEDLSDLKSKGCLLRHKKSGARVLMMSNEDENKVFAIGFRTRRRIVRGCLILWSIPCCAALRIFR